MKTKQIYYIAALAMLTACTNNEEYETVTNNGLQKVTFADPFVGKNLTRASGDITTDGTEGTTSALTSFKIRVWGQEINQPENALSLTVTNGIASNNQSETPFNGGSDISHSENGWAADKEFYYPRDKYTFRFAAFAPVDAINTAGVGTDPNGVVLNMTDQSLTFSGAGANTYGITNIPLVQEISNTDGNKAGWDLLVSNRFLSEPTNGVQNRADINFTFQHILSKLSFYVYASESTDKKFYVKSIKAYLPKDNWTGSYKQNDQTAKPTAETKDSNPTENANNWDTKYHDTWAWVNKTGTTGAFDNIPDVVTPSDFDSKIVNDNNNSYQEYVVFTKTSTDDKGDEVTLTGYNTTPSSGTDNITCKSYFLAPTPAAEGEGNVKEFNFYVKIEYTVEETTGENTSTTKDYTGYLDLSKSDLKRFRQGWHHKVYIGLAHKTIRFISASVDNWDNHDEDMTVSREVDGWTSEQN